MDTLHSNVLSALYSSSNSIRRVKLRGIKRAGHETSINKMANIYSSLVGEHQGKRQLGSLMHKAE
jgi:hypothetical protein